jgi:hypothetical protein
MFVKILRAVTARTAPTLLAVSTGTARPMVCARTLRTAPALTVATRLGARVMMETVPSSMSPEPKLVTQICATTPLLALVVTAPRAPTLTLLSAWVRLVPTA